MRLHAIPALVLAAALSAAAASDALGTALALPEGDIFAADRINEALILAPRAERAAAVRRIADSRRDDVHPILHRLILDDDPASAAIAIDALAGRWPTTMADADGIRALIARDGPVGAAACRYAAAIGDDEAIAELAERLARRPGDADAEAAMRQLMTMPAGAGEQGWGPLVDMRLTREEAALANAERLIGGSVSEAMGAMTLVAGLRPAGSRAARILLAAAEHPDRAVRSMAMSLLATCEAPPAAAWRAVRAGAPVDEVMASATAAPAVPDVAPAFRPDGVVAGPVAAAAPAEAPVASSSWGWVLTGLALVGLAGGGFVVSHRLRHASRRPVPHRAGRITWAE